MTPEQIFSLASLIVVVPWLLLVLLPGHRWVTDLVSSVIVPALLAIVYVGIVVTTFGRGSGGFSTLQDVGLLFSNPWALLAGWIHYLAFDLLVGTWEVRDARERGIPHLLVVPCLVLTFLLGPSGWLLYIIIRSIHLRGRRTLAAAA